LLEATSPLYTAAGYIMFVLSKAAHVSTFERYREKYIYRKKNRKMK